MTWLNSLKTCFAEKAREFSRCFNISRLKWTTYLPTRINVRFAFTGLFRIVGNYKFNPKFRFITIYKGIHFLRVGKVYLVRELIIPIYKDIHDNIVLKFWRKGLRESETCITKRQTHIKAETKMQFDILCYKHTCTLLYNLLNGDVRCYKSWSTRSPSRQIHILIRTKRVSCVRKHFRCNFFIVFPTLFYIPWIVQYIQDFYQTSLEKRQLLGKVFTPKQIPILNIINVVEAVQVKHPEADEFRWKEWAALKIW